MVSAGQSAFEPSMVGGEADQTLLTSSSFGDATSEKADIMSASKQIVFKILLFIAASFFLFILAQISAFFKS